MRIGERPTISKARAQRRMGATLAVCCMTSGRRPALLAGILAPLRSIADEIVIAVETSFADEVRAAVADVADTVLVFPRVAPVDRPIAWLFGACSATWIFNIDDDEVASPALVASLPEIVQRDDVTHAWIARRWLYPTAETYLATRPWSSEFQLRLVLSDDRFLQFSDAFHRPVICHGPGLYVESALWHLDLAMNPAANRRGKATAYERERPGMRLDGLAHNTGLYLPELHPDLRLLPVPLEDRDAIDAARSFRPSLSERRSEVVLVQAAEVDRSWVGPPYPESLYDATLACAAAPAAMTAGVQHTVDVRVTNQSGAVWRWGKDARPEIRLSYRWWGDGTVVSDPNPLRTTLPADLAPGQTDVVPVHVVAPERPGVYGLELDLIHERVRWFGRGTLVDVEVRGRPQGVAVIASAERLPELVARLGLRPEVEPIVLLRDPVDRDAYGEYTTIGGLRHHLLRGSEKRGRLGTLGRLLWRTIMLMRPNRGARPGDRGYEPVCAARNSTDRLVVDSPNWRPGAAFVREWWVLAATAIFWRLGGRDVVICDGAMPAGHGARAIAVRWVLRRIATGHREQHTAADIP